MGVAPASVEDARCMEAGSSKAGPGCAPPCTSHAPGEGGAHQVEQVGTAPCARLAGLHTTRHTLPSNLIGQPVSTLHAQLLVCCAAWESRASTTSPAVKAARHPGAPLRDPDPLFAPRPGRPAACALPLPEPAAGDAGTWGERFGEPLR